MQLLPCFRHALLGKRTDRLGTFVTRFFFVFVVLSIIVYLCSLVSQRFRRIPGEKPPSTTLNPTPKTLDPRGLDPKP